MKLFYVVPTEKAAELVNSWHALDLGEGMALVCVHWKDENHEMIWSSHPDVKRLPHPIFESTQALTDEHLIHLNRRYAALNNTHTVHDLIKHASKEDPFMRLHVL